MKYRRWATFMDAVEWLLTAGRDSPDPNFDDEEFLSSINMSGLSLESKTTAGRNESQSSISQYRNMNRNAPNTFKAPPLPSPVITHNHTHSKVTKKGDISERVKMKGKEKQSPIPRNEPDNIGV